jgi:hypothetical protein
MTVRVATSPEIGDMSENEQAPGKDRQKTLSKGINQRMGYKRQRRENTKAHKADAKDFPLPVPMAAQAQRNHRGRQDDRQQKIMKELLVEPSQLCHRN